MNGDICSVCKKRIGTCWRSTVCLCARCLIVLESQELLKRKLEIYDEKEEKKKRTQQRNKLKQLVVKSKNKNKSKHLHKYFFERNEEKILGNLKNKNFKRNERTRF